MRRKRSTTVLIGGGTAVLMIVILIAVISIYDTTLRENQSSHQLQQLEMAKAATLGITTYLNHIVDDMHLLTSMPELQYPQISASQPAVDIVYQHYNKEAIRTIFVLNSQMVVQYARGADIPPWVLPSLKKNLDQIKNKTSANQCWYSKVHPDFEKDPERGMSFMMVIPYKRISGDKAAPAADMKQTGFVGYILNFNRLVRYFIEPLKLSKSDFAWVLDGSGRLIFHPRHKEMLLRTPSDSTSDCLECHLSFDLQKRMIGSQASTGEYTISDEPPKVMAYVPINLNNEKWVLAISTFLPQVTAKLRSQFHLFFILGVLILGSVFALGYALYNINSKRIRAEEAKRQSEQLQQLQQQLNQTSKLASIGELVDTVAHEINTPTGIISAHADVLLLQAKLPETNMEEVQVIKQQTQRISKYTRTLLDYSKRVPFNPIPLEVTETIDECLYLLGHRFRARKVALIKEYEKHLPRVLLDRGQMEQVFINLLNNAIDAFEKNGEICIAVKKHQRESALDEQMSMDGLQIEVSDTGKGISPETIDQIFEPFYSSKPPNEGTGLGLYISRSIIQRHHGTIKVRSKLNQGTTFSIFLPLNFRGPKE